MKVKPNLSYKLLGTEIQLDKTKVYNAVLATNQPDWESKGLIFVEGVLLGEDEYFVVEPEACTVCNKGNPCMFWHDCQQNDRHECQECYDILST